MTFRRLGHAQQHRQNINGLCLSEQRIIDLWDAGEPIDCIMRATGYHRKTVSDTIARLSDGGESRRIDTAQRAADSAFLAALQAAQGLAA